MKVNVPKRLLKPRQSYQLSVIFERISTSAVCLCIDQGDGESQLFFSADHRPCDTCPRVDNPTYITEDAIKSKELTLEITYRHEGAFNLTVVTHSKASGQSVFFGLQIIVDSVDPACQAPNQAEFENMAMTNSSTPLTFKTTTVFTVRAHVYGGVCTKEDKIKFKWQLSGTEKKTVGSVDSGTVIELPRILLSPGDYQVDLLFVQKTSYGELESVVLTGYLRILVVPVNAVFSKETAGMRRIAVHSDSAKPFCLSPGENTFNPNTGRSIVMS